MSLTSPIFLSSAPITSVPLNFDASRWSNRSLGVGVRPLPEVLALAFGAGVAVRGGGWRGGYGRAKLRAVATFCAIALVNANPLTAATAMKCLNMSASLGRLSCEWVIRSLAAKPASCMVNAGTPPVFPVPVTVAPRFLKREVQLGLSAFEQHVNECDEPFRAIEIVHSLLIGRFRNRLIVEVYPQTETAC